MADDVEISAGTGTKTATDQVSGTLEHVQLVKLAIATDGSRTAIPADGTDGLLVNLGTNNDVTVTGTVTVQDGGNTITVDNGGSFAVQATLGAETTKVIGTINVAAAQTIAVTQGTAGA